MAQSFRSQITVCLVLTSLTGCVSGRGEYNKDVSRADVGWAGFERSKIYESKVSLFLGDGEDGLGPQLKIEKGTHIEAYRYYTPFGPTTAADYKTDPGKWPDVIGILEAGTRIRATELREPGEKLGLLRVLYVGAPRYRYVRGIILDGPYAGTTADMRAVSDYVYDFETNYAQGRRYVLVGPNLALITPVQD